MVSAGFLMRYRRCSAPGEVVVESLALPTERIESVDPALREQLLEPFIAGAQLTFNELFATDVMVETIYHLPVGQTLGAFSAAVDLRGPGITFVLTFTAEAAYKVAGQLLAEAASPPDEQLMCDCLAEMANIISGQAKTLCHGTPYQFVFSPPRVLNGTGRSLAAGPERECLVISFTSVLGAFAVQLFLDRHGTASVCV
jgi:CheY-specific phosphatase CheX